ncbi:MAG: thiamine phosphate synthase [Candidatus Eisenbacteria bacterium]
MRAIDLSLYAIVDRDVGETLTIEEFTEGIIAGGTTCLQVRLKTDTTRSFIDFTRRVLAVAAVTGTPVIVNDRVDVALATGTDGIHLGDDDMTVADARRICGKALVIGASVRDLESARAMSDAGADYLGVGPVFATPVKPDLAPIAPGTLRSIRSEISLPIVAIGGINEKNVATPLGEGADGVAVISALRRCQSPKEAASRLRTAIDHAKKR